MKANLLWLISFFSAGRCNINTFAPDPAVQQMYAEYHKYFSLENARDDDFIYRFGLLGQQNSEIVEQSHQRIEFFPHIYSLLHNYNKFTNAKTNFLRAALENDPEQRDWGLKPEPESHVREREAAARDAARQMAAILLTEGADLKTEVEMLFQNSLQLYIGIEDCLHILGLREFFDQAADRADKQSLVFYNAAVKIDLQCFSLNSRLQFFLKSIDQFRNITRKYEQMFDYKRSAIFKDKLVNYNFGFEMVETIMKSKKGLESSWNDLAAGALVFMEVKGEIVRLIEGMRQASESALLDQLNSAGFFSVLWVGVGLLFAF